MSSPAERLIAQLRAARLSWFAIEGTSRRLQILRPTEVEMITERGRTALEAACAQVVGWDGFTEADLLGPELGSDQVADFTPELWAAYVADRAELTAAVAMEVRRIQADYLQRRQEQAKN
jgi:hypothetical protein